MTGYLLGILLGVAINTGLCALAITYTRWTRREARNIVPMWSHEAEVILHAARTHNRRAAEKAALRLQRNHGTAGMLHALTYWLDALILAKGIDPERYGPGDEIDAQGTIVNVETGQEWHPDDAPPEFAWAMRLLVARITRNHDEFFRILNESNERNVGQHINAVLVMAATTINETDKERDGT